MSIVSISTLNLELYIFYIFHHLWPKRALFVCIQKHGFCGNGEKRSNCKSHSSKRPIMWSQGPCQKPLIKKAHQVKPIAIEAHLEKNGLFAWCASHDADGLFLDELFCTPIPMLSVFNIDYYSRAHLSMSFSYTELQISSPYYPGLCSIQTTVMSQILGKLQVKFK